MRALRLAQHAIENHDVTTAAANGAELSSILEAENAYSPHLGVAPTLLASDPCETVQHKKSMSMGRSQRD